MISRLSDDKSRAAIAASIEGRRIDTRGLLFVLSFRRACW